MREVAGEDRTVQPPDVLSVHLQSTSPERSLGVHENTSQLVAESVPSVLRREAVGLVEARVLVVAITRTPRFVHPPSMPSDADPWRIRHSARLLCPGVSAQARKMEPTGIKPMSQDRF